MSFPDAGCDEGGVGVKIVYWADYACPYCYIGVTRLEKAIESLGLGDEAEIEMKAFELNPDAPREAAGTTVERYAAKHGLSMELAARRIGGMNQVGRDEGIDLNYAMTLYANMLDAHRMTKLAHSLGNGRFEKLCYEAYFVKNEVLADCDVLARIAEEAGLPAADVERVLATDEYEAEVRADEDEAHRRGVYSVPFFMIEGEHTISGCYPTEEMARALMKARGEALEESPGHAWGVRTQSCGNVW